MVKIMVRWWPPYSNGYKDQPCVFENEAAMMCNWFVSIGVRANVVRVFEHEEIDR